MKTIVKVSFAILLLVELFAFSGFTPTVAETRDQMRYRIIQEYIERYDVMAVCDADCVATRESENPWLFPLAQQLNIDHETVTRGSVGHSIEWGYDFWWTKHANTDCAAKSAPGNDLCAPTIYDWIEAWPHIGADYLHRLDTTPPLFKVDEWSESRHIRYAQEYGGPY